MIIGRIDSKTKLKSFTAKINMESNKLRVDNLDNLGFYLEIDLSDFVRKIQQDYAGKLKEEEEYYSGTSAAEVSAMIVGRRH